MGITNIKIKNLHQFIWYILEKIHINQIHLGNQKNHKHICTINGTLEMMKFTLTLPIATFE